MQWKYFKNVCVNCNHYNTFRNRGTINSVHADSIEQQIKSGIEQETDKQIIVKFKADLICHMKMVLKNKYNLKRMIK